MSADLSGKTSITTSWPPLFPNRDQYLVLQAALGDGEKALSAYLEWVGSLDISKEFDREVFRLMPLLYDNLRRLGHQDHLTGRLKGAYRMAWAKNHRVFEETRPILDSFLENGLDVMVIKGAPLAMRYYNNVAVRPMSDVDLVVPGGSVAIAVQILQDAGFKPWRYFNEDAKRYRHAMAFYAPENREFDLHWRFLFELSDGAADDFFRRSATPFHFLGHDIATLDATRTLIHTILHGLKWNIEPPIRWIPDCMMILRSRQSPVDWAALVAFAVSNRVTYRLHLGLSYLATEFGAAVPRPVLMELDGGHGSLIERLETALTFRAIDYESAFGPLLDAMAEYPGLRTSRSATALLIDFSHFLRYHWQLRGRREIPQRLLRGILRRARRLFRT